MRPTTPEVEHTSSPPQRSTLLHRFGTAYERQSHSVVPSSTLAAEPSYSTLASIPPASVDLPIALCEGRHATLKS